MPSLVCKINCFNCIGVYIGESSQNLQKRISKYINNSKKKDQYKTMLTEHINNHHQSIDFSKSRILHFETNIFEMRFSEDCLILLCNKAINKYTDSNLLTKYE